MCNFRLEIIETQLRRRGFCKVSGIWEEIFHYSNIFDYLSLNFHVRKI